MNIESPITGKSGCKSNHHHEQPMKNEQQSNKRNLVGRIGKTSCALFIDGRILGQNLKFLLDTGSIITIISHETYMKIDEQIRPNLTPSKMKLMGADDSSLEVYGQFDCDLGILRQSETMFTVTVVDISGDGLLGMDFIQYYGCEIYPSSMSMMCQNEQIRMSDSETVGINNIKSTKCYRVMTSSNALIPPHSKSILSVRQKQRSGYLGKWAIVEPTLSYQDDELYRDGCIIGKALVDTENEVIPLPIINVSDEPVMIPAGRTIGMLYTVNTIDSMMNERRSNVNDGTKQDRNDANQPTVEVRSEVISDVLLESKDDSILRSMNDRGFQSKDCGFRSLTNDRGFQSRDCGFRSENDRGSGYPVFRSPTGDRGVRSPTGDRGFVGGRRPGKINEVDRKFERSVHMLDCGSQIERDQMSNRDVKINDDVHDVRKPVTNQKSEESKEIQGIETCEEIEAMIERGTKYLDEKQVDQVKNLVYSYHSLFSKNNTDIGKAVGIKHSIETGDSPPLRQPMRRMPIHQLGEIDKQVEQMLNMGVIEPSMSPWNSGIVLVAKRDSSFRFCIDFRLVNAVTKPGHTSYVQRIDTQLDSLQGSKWFTTLDVTSAYWNIEMNEDSKEKTAFSTRKGHWQFRRLPFGLVGSGYTYTRFMQHIMAGLEFSACLIYLDDVICVGKNFEEALENLGKIFDRLIQAGVKLKPKKCFLFQKETDFLGYRVSENGIGTSPDKIETVKSWPQPRNVSDVRSFLGLVTYYKNFIPMFGDKAKPLHDLTRKDRVFEWTTEAEISFNELKQCLISAPILAYPNITGRFVLDTDCSGFAMGGIISQIQNTYERVIAYGSKTLNQAEKNYCVTRRELLAVVTFVKKFRHYLYGKRFTVRTDHMSLKWLMNFKEPEGQVARWIEYLSTFDFEIIHRPGKDHGAADALSRRPCKFCDRYDLKEAHCDRINPEGLINNVSVKHEEKLSCCEMGVQTDHSGPLEDAVTPRIKWIPKKWYHQSKKPVRRRRPTDYKRVNAVTIGDDEWSDSNVAKIQREDAQLRWIIQLKENHQTRPTWESIALQSESNKHYWSMWDQIELRNNVLCQRYESEDGRSVQVKTVLPQVLHKEMFNQLHAVNTAAHLGSLKTYEKIKRRFYYKNLKQIVYELCEKCDRCASRKSPPHKSRGSLQTYLVGNPLERVSADILGPLPLTARRNKYILIVGDHFTKWTEAYALPNQEAETVANKIVSEFVCRYGTFRQFHTDKGTNFESNVMKEVCDMLQIQKTSTTPYHPQSDGMIERYNHTLENSLSTMVKKNQKDWDLKLPYAMMAYRTAIHCTTKYSPYYLCFGREANLPIDIMYGSPNEDQIEVSEFTSKLKKNLEAAFENARENIRSEHVRQKRVYDQRSHGKPYKPGDFVWLYQPRRKKGITTKLSCNWIGPFMITKKLSDTVYRIQRSRNTKPKVIHYDRLKLYRGTNAVPWTVGERTPEIVTDVDANHVFSDVENDINVHVEQNNDSKTENHVEEIETDRNAKEKRKRKPPIRLIES
jgi:hypothetical protein